MTKREIVRGLPFLLLTHQEDLIRLAMAYNRAFNYVSQHMYNKWLHTTCKDTCYPYAQRTDKGRYVYPPQVWKKMTQEEQEASREDLIHADLRSRAMTTEEKALIKKMTKEEVKVFKESLPKQYYRHDLKHVLREEVYDALKAMGFTRKTDVRNIVMEVCQSYAGYKKRHNNKKDTMSSPITRKGGKAISFRDILLDIKDGRIRIPSLNNERLSVKYKNPGTSKRMAKYTKKGSFGGNIKYSGSFSVKDNGDVVHHKKGAWTFIMAIKRVMEYYDHRCYCGTDFNQKPTEWIVMRFWYGRPFIDAQEPIDTITIARPQHIQDIECKINDVCSQLKAKDDQGCPLINKSSQPTRRFLNKKREALHKEHGRAILPYIKKMIKTIEDRSAYVILDDVTTGETKGTWGQDKLTSTCPTICDKLGIPHVLGEPAFTSRRCPKCGDISKKNRHGDEFCCTNCGHCNNAHHNAADNTIVMWFEKQAEKADKTAKEARDSD